MTQHFTIVKLQAVNRNSFSELTWRMVCCVLGWARGCLTEKSVEKLMHKNIVSIAYVPPEKIDYAWDLAWNIDNGNENLKVVIFPSSQRHSAPPPPIMDYPNRSMIQAFHLNGNDLIMWRELGGLAAGGSLAEAGAVSHTFCHLLGSRWSQGPTQKLDTCPSWGAEDWRLREQFECVWDQWVGWRRGGGRYFPFSLPGPLPSPLSHPLQPPARDTISGIG